MAHAQCKGEATFHAAEHAEHDTWRLEGASNIEARVCHVAFIELAKRRGNTAGLWWLCPEFHKCLSVSTCGCHSGGSGDLFVCIQTLSLLLLQIL